MKKTAHTILQFTLVAICCGVALAQPEKRQNITAEKKSESKPGEAETTLFPYHPIGSWAGKRFVFLPKPKGSESGTYEDFNRAVTHRKYAGRVARVVSANDSGASAYIEFEMEDDGERLRVFTVANKESVRGMALLDDIENARKQWAGKTLWSKMLMISSYDEQSDAITMTQVKKFGPLKVVDVVPGWDEEKPVRFRLETPDGKQGFVDLNLSGTNVQKEVRYQSRFEDHLLAEDPKLKYKWRADVWSSIEKGQVYVGMTEEQVKMSWGEPEKVARTAAGDVWTYQSGALVFKKGVMTGSQ
ncbi:MAG TPA: hypothetical protein VFV58_25980 [Blastocatellia bacterium]|jgi:hypothetical protein|nr:hypothetical protein [Blastocatellia bacterium]